MSTSGRAHVDGQRRVITILFCDVAGSTAMAERIDPEDWAEVMNEAFGHMTAPIERFGGTVARLMGDGVLAFFGAPTAHEDDPERAVLAGLAIIEGIEGFGAWVKQQFGVEFKVRVGINTGPAVVGDIGGHVASEYTAMGDAVNMAARMEQTAKPGTLQVSDRTWAHVAPLFDAEELSGIEVKGRDERVTVYRVIAPKPRSDRRRGVRVASAPLVGRDDDRNLLRSVVDRALLGAGRVVCLVGDAGTGKSRLLEEMHAHWASAAPTDAPWIASRGVSYDTTRPYALFVHRIKQMFEVQEDDAGHVLRAKVARGLEAMALTSDRVPLCTAAAQSILAARAADTPQVPAASLQREVHDVMTEVWRSMASQAPCVAVFDDLHWADSASIDLLMHLVQLTRELPIVVVAALRPVHGSYAVSLRDRCRERLGDRFEQIDLAPLAHRDSVALLDALVGGLPDETRAFILEKAEGNPLYLEEVVRALVDRGAVVRESTGLRWSGAVNTHDLVISESLNGLLSSRIDQLDRPTRECLQFASVIGRQFESDVLQQIAERDVSRDVRALCDAEVVDAIDAPSDGRWAFRHLMMRDAAYGSILRRSRPLVHRRVGEAIERRAGNELDAHAHRLAHHFFEAADYPRAAAYAERAAHAAAVIFANREALRLVDMAIDAHKRGEFEPGGIDRLADFRAGLQRASVGA